MVGRNDLRGMTDAWQAYIDLALGFTETSRKRATKVVKQLAGKGNTTADQLQAMAEELVNTGLANRESMVRLIRFELDRALGRVGLATADEVADLTGRMRELEEKLRAAESALAHGVPAAPIAEEVVLAVVPATASAPARTAPAKRAPAKTVAKKAAAPAAGSTATKAAPTKAAPTKAAPAKTVAKKTVAKKAVATKTTGSTP